RLVQVRSTQRIADSHSGYDVYMNVPQGNGTFTTNVASANTGSGSIDVGTVVDRGSRVPDDYTIRFTTPTDWEITDGATPANVVAGGAYTPGEPIEFRGVRVTIGGAPAAGDSFEVQRARSEDMFTTISDLVEALRQPAGSPAANARLASVLQGSLQQIDQASDHL